MSRQLLNLGINSSHASKLKVDSFTAQKISVENIQIAPFRVGFWEGIKPHRRKKNEDDEKLESTFTLPR